MRILLVFGADVNKCDKRQKTPTDVAAEMHDVRMISLHAVNMQTYVVCVCGKHVGGTCTVLTDEGRLYRRIWKAEFT